MSHSRKRWKLEEKRNLLELARTRLSQLRGRSHDTDTATISTTTSYSLAHAGEACLSAFFSDLNFVTPSLQQHLTS